MKAYIIYLVLLNTVLYVPAATINDPTEGIGQFNKRLARIAPNMIYLGNFGSKGWYAFNEPVTQPIARQNCGNFGMKLGIIDSQAELEFIANRVTGPLYHTDGNYLCKPSSFRWSTGQRELSPDLQIVQAYYGLLLQKAFKGLHSPGDLHNESPYLCFISLGSLAEKDAAAIESGTAIKKSGIPELAYNGVVSNQTIQALTYLGKYGYKSFYYDDTLVYWPTAKENCEKMGMTFARFDSQDELLWILSVLPYDQDRIWTDGEVKQGSQYWYWIYNGENLNSGITISDQSWGLVLDRSQRSLQILIKLHELYKFPYLCFIVSAVWMDDSIKSPVEFMHS